MSKPMTEHHKETLQRVRSSVVADMDLKRVVDSLVTSGILTSEDEDCIENRSSTYDGIRFLLRLLPRKGDGAFFALHDALKSTPWLQEQMRNDDEGRCETNAYLSRNVCTKSPN